MPKKPKTAKTPAPAEHREEADSSPSLAKPEIPASQKAAKKAGKPAAKKSAAPRKSKGAKAAGTSQGAEPTADQIQLRAYFISEHRQRLGVAGDHHSDWLEARRQLILETRRK